MISTVMVDLDGVLVDFAKGFNENAFDLTDIPMDDINGDPVGFWLKENAKTTEFFQNLEPMPEFESMKNLMERLAFNYEVKILSSCGDYDPYEIIRQKRMWLERHGLGMVQFNWCESSYQKSFFADPRTILIDDRKESCNPFRSAGGNAILYQGFDQLLDELDDYRLVY